MLLTPDGGVWKTLKINGKKWLLANTTNKVEKLDRVEPSMFIVFDNKTVARNTSLFIPKQKLSKPELRHGDVRNRISVDVGNDLDDYDEEESSEELMVREILNNLQLLKEQEKLALLGPDIESFGPDDGILNKLDHSVKIVLVDKIKDKEMMTNIKDLEEGEMILMDDDYGSSNDHSSNVHARHQQFEPKKRKVNEQAKTYNVVVKRKPRRRQRVKLQRGGYGNKVQKVYITY